ncbi:hypothetical protein VTN77DRAFT_9669 [Rasamsonia byssochlamydoides]|uniref:uncharacterized protein n=1 Tax=Rasamsonia byssochlamydoides TaxID=89139 RepID=UPI00374450CE
MDPLSVSASIIAVLQITNSVSSCCMKYVRSAKNAKTELLRLVQELGGLQIVLTTLKELIEQSSNLVEDEKGLLSTSEDQYLFPTLRRLCGLEYVFEECLRKLKQLERDITPPTVDLSLSKKEAIIHALRWPIKEAYMRSILDDISQYITLFSLALTLDETNAVLDIRDTTLATYSTVQSLKALQDDEKKRRDADDIVQWLSAPDPSVDYTDALQRRVSNTGSWLICGKQYSQWKCCPGSLLWIHGTAGCGKTILSSTVIEDLLCHCGSDLNLAVAYFYFKLDDVSKRNHTGMLRSLIKQLFERSNRNSQALTELFDKRNQPTSSQLLSTLHDMISDFGRTYIVLDALDECEEREDLFEVLEEIGRWKAVNIHVLLTSRDEKDIKDSIEPICMTQDHIKLSAAVTKEDIRTYIRERLRTDRALKRWRTHPKVQEEIESSLTEKSDGMFQWVMCQLKALEKCIRPSQLRKALESLPETLNETYAQMLGRISEENYEIALRIFQWLLFSARPLYIEELAELAAVDFGNDPPVIERLFDPDEILKICPGLITTIEEHSDWDKGESKIVVRLTHISVREYLLSHEIQKGQAAKYRIEETAAHTSITETCLLYMRLIDKPLPDANEEFPLALYTAENWLYHYERVPEHAEGVHELALEFFLKREKEYLNWISFFCSLVPPRIHPDLTDSALDSPLNIVAAYGLLPTLKLMFANDEIGTNSEPVLKEALRFAYLGRLPPHPNIETTRLLLQHGADFSGDPKFFHTFHAASYFGFDEIVEIQLGEGFDVNTRGGTFNTALQAAVAGRHDLHFKEMSQTTWPDGWLRPGEKLENLFPTTVKLLLEKGADPNLCGGRGGSPLLAACFQGDLPCVTLLLDHGADSNFESIENTKGNLDFYRSCLSAACRSRDIRIIQLLLNHGADINSPRALAAATWAGDINIMRLLLERGADPNIDEGNLETPLQIACSNLQPEAVELLLEYGANPNIGGGRFGTPLQTASATYGSVETLKLLIGKGADVNHVGGAFGTALHAAAFYGDLEMVQYLIANGADINLQGRLFHSVLRTALQNGHTDIFIFLLKQGADFDIPGGRYGDTLRETLASVPPTKTELTFRTGTGYPNAPSLCVIRRNGASFWDFDNITLEDRGPQDGANDLEWDCLLPDV